MSQPDVPAQVILRPGNADPFDTVNGEVVIHKNGRHCRIGYQDATARNGVRLCDNNEPFASRQALREHVLYWHAKAPRNEIYLVKGSRSHGPANVIARQRRTHKRAVRARRIIQPAPVPAPAGQVAAQNAAEAAVILGRGPQTFTTTVFPQAAPVGGGCLSYNVLLRPTAVDQAHLAQHAAASGSQTGGTGQPDITQVFGDGGEERMV